VGSCFNERIVRIEKFGVGRSGCRFVRQPVRRLESIGEESISWQFCTSEQERLEYVRNLMNSLLNFESNPSQMLFMIEMAAPVICSAKRQSFENLVCFVNE
jgi:hypothetical protein